MERGAVSKVDSKKQKLEKYVEANHRGPEKPVFFAEMKFC